MQHVEHLPRGFPWRTATIAAAAVAVVELFALLAIGVVRLAPKHHTAGTPAKPAAAEQAQTAHRPVHVARVAAHPLRPRSHVRVLVLNGNGVTGAAGIASQRLERRGYRIGGAANAPRHDYARSLVMYLPGWAKEARRLGRDAGVRSVSPLDGLRRSRLHGAKVVLLLGG